MKKIKIFLLVITILLMILFLFATCHKTNAYTYTYNNPLDETHITYSAQTNNSLAMILNLNSDSFNVFSIYDSVSLHYYVDCIYSSSYYTFRLWNNDIGLSYPEYTVNFSNVDKYFYLQLCYDYIDDKVYLLISPINFTISNRQDDSPYISNIFLPTGGGVLWELDNSYFINNFISSQSSTYIKISYVSSYYFTGLYNLWTFDAVSQLSQDVEEQIDFIFDDLKSSIPITYLNNLINTYYYQGYNAGYNTGYLRGDNDGFNRGYQQGYQEGSDDTRQVAYDEGYLDGESDGYQRGLQSQTAYQEGYDVGYSDGEQSLAPYQNGYDKGYSDGQAGNTAITPIFNTLKGVFAVVGTVMSVELAPHVPLGIFILVPLFFACIGLILWIWRRN